MLLERADWDLLRIYVDALGPILPLREFSQRSVLVPTMPTSLSPRPERFTTTTVVRGQLALEAHDLGQGVGALQGREDAFDSREQPEGVQHLLVRRPRRTRPGRCP